MKRILLITAAAALAVTAAGGKDASRPPQEAETFLTDVPAVSFDVVQGRPTADSITLNIRSAGARSGVVECGEIRQPFTVEAGGTAEVRLSGLAPGRREWKIGSCHGSFRTARRPGEPFTFTAQADSHLDGSCIPELYRTMLANIASENPDFNIDLGDTFMTGKHPSRESAAKQYLAQRYYFGLIGNHVPLFLVLGNHDGEEVKRAGETELADWSRSMRMKYFSNPEPDGFYTGNNRHLQNYYAWNWGDALFVVLDPYTYSTSTHGGRDLENMTLGDEQFSWLEKTLRESSAGFKFIFIHQLTGGLGAGNRGGAEAAHLHQWARVHELLRRHHVDIVFHGHDHFYARQETDGVIYQLVPQGATRNFRRHFAEEYGYKEGDFLPNDGHLLVSVSPAKVTVSYIASAVESMARRGAVNGEVKKTYSLQK